MAFSRQRITVLASIGAVLILAIGAFLVMRHFGISADENPTAPTIVSAVTLDEDHDGKSDMVKIVFSSEMDTSIVSRLGFNFLFPLSNYLIASDEGRWMDNKTFGLSIEGIARNFYDNKQYGTLFYSGESMRGSNQLPLAPVSGFTILDESKPVIASATAIARNVSEGVQTGDVVWIHFSEIMSKPNVTSDNIGTLLALNNGHTWGNISSAVWDSTEDQLTITLDATAATPTIARGDTITPSADFSDKATPANSAYAAPVTIEGTFGTLVHPELVSLITGDADGNGKIDQYTLKFNKDMDQSGTAAGFTVADHTVLSGSWTDARTFVLKFNEGSEYDTGNVPQVTYSSTDGNIKDTTADHFALGQFIKNGTDGAGIALVQATAVPKDATAGHSSNSVDLKFSEAANVVVNKDNINQVLTLSNNHSWLDGSRSLASEVAVNQSELLSHVYLGSSGGAPTIAVGDTITLGSEFKDAAGNSPIADRSVAISGSLDSSVANTQSSSPTSTQSSYENNTAVTNVNKSATISVTPSAVTKTVGQPFYITLTVLGNGQDFISSEAAVETNNLTVISIGKSSDVANWLTQPSITSLGYHGVLGQSKNAASLYTIKVKGNQAGSASLSIKNGVVKNAQESDIFSSAASGNYTIAAAQTAEAPSASLATAVAALPSIQNDFNNEWVNYATDASANVTVAVGESAIFDSAASTLSGIVLSGTIQPDADGYVTVFSNSIVKTFHSDANGFWSIKLSEALAAGNHSAYVTAVKNGVKTRASKALVFAVDIAGKKVAEVSLPETVEAAAAEVSSANETPAASPVATESSKNWIWIGAGVLLVLVLVMLLVRKIRAKKDREATSAAEPLNISEASLVSSEQAPMASQPAPDTIQPLQSSGQSEQAAAEQPLTQPTDQNSESGQGDQQL